MYRLFALLTSALALSVRRTPTTMRADESYDKSKLAGARSKFVSATGRLYAPWLENQVDDEATARARDARAEKRKRIQRAADRDGKTGFMVEGLTSEVGGGDMRLAGSVVARPADEGDAATVEIRWANAGGNLRVERKCRGAQWTTIATGARSPLTDVGAQIGENLYRIKNGGSIVAQVGVLVETAAEKQANLALVGGLGALLALVAVVGSSFDAIPKV